MGILAVELATGEYPHNTTVECTKGRRACEPARLWQGGMYALMSRIVEDPTPVPTAAEFSSSFCDLVAQWYCNPHSRNATVNAA